MVVLYCLFSTLQTTSAIQPSAPCVEADLYAAGVAVVNCSGSAVCPVTPNAMPTPSTTANGASVYMLGDSITVQSTSFIESEIAASPNGYTLTKINADSGRAITYDSGGSPLAPSGIEAVVEDASIIRTSDVVVIALGTNSGNEDLNIQIPALIKEVRNTGFVGKIYWVDLFYTSKAGPSIRNSVIYRLATTELYTVIRASQANIQLSEDEVHPTDAGRQTFAQTTINGLALLPSVQTQVQPTSSGSCTCPASTGFTGSINNTITWGDGVWGSGADPYVSGLSGPYTMEQWAIHVLKNISRKTGISESQMVTEAKIISLIAWSRAEGGGINGNNGTFNPLNTKLAHSDLQGVNQGNASTDSNSQGYPTFDLGVEAITRGLFGTFQKRIGSALLSPDFAQDTLIEAVAGDFSSPDGVTVINNLEEIYPGDRAYATLSITGYDYGGGIGNRDLYVSIKRQTLENVRKDYAKYAGVILDGSPPGTPAPLTINPTSSSAAVPYSGGACKQPDGGEVLADGYTFPLAPQTKAGIGGVTVGQTDSSHWDESPAFDLFGPTNADVYAIYGGTPVKVNTNLNDVQGCSSVQFEADDGFFYWYGHLREVTVQEGVHVDSGVKIGEVVDASLGTKCTGNGGPHLHIDRGCTTAEGPQWGGNRGCRDPEFIKLLSKIYEGLP